MKSIVASFITRPGSQIYSTWFEMCRYRGFYAHNVISIRLSVATKF